MIFFYSFKAITVSSNMAMTSSVDDDDESNHEFVNWVVDKKFLVVKKHQNIPDDPNSWTEDHVQVWLKWAINQFGLRLHENEWHMTGKELCDLSLQDFQKKIPRDPGNKFWTHLELLRKCHFIAIPGDPKSDEEIVGSDSIREKNAIFKKNPRFIGKPKLIDATNVESVLPSNQGNRTGNNGQIQLW